MRKIVLIIIIMVSINLTSCYFFGPVDAETKNVDFNNIDIIGTWKLDKFSYEYLSKKKDKIDSIYITFKSDSTFVLNNSNALFLTKTDLTSTKKVNGIIDNSQTKGNWKIVQYETQKDLELTYEDQTHQPGINIYKKDQEFQLWYFFGDPDAGERLRFVKN